MPLKVKRLLISCFITSALTAVTFGQDNQAELTKQRISKAKALAATRNLTAAAFELEKIRKETADEAALNAASVMLTSIYLEQADYNRVQSILDDSFQKYNTKKNGCYFSVVGQILKGARAQVERYKQLGWQTSDANLPPEVSADLDRWRKMLEGMLDQTKQLAVKNQKTTEAFVLMEDIANARALVARDTYDAQHWQTAIEDVREAVAQAQTSVAEVEDPSTAPTNSVAPTTIPVNANAIAKIGQPATIPASAKIETEDTLPNRPPTPIFDNSIASLNPSNPAPTEELPEPENRNAIKLKPVSEKVTKPVSSNSGLSQSNPNPDEVAKAERQREIDRNNNSEPITVKTKAPKDGNNFAGNPDKADLMTVGSLVDYATKKVSPVYPPFAKNARVIGVVRVQVIVDEEGSVTNVQNADGPELLKRAATDAIKRWKFKPVLKDGQPVRVSGFISFNFTL